MRMTFFAFKCILSQICPSFFACAVRAVVVASSGYLLNNSHANAAGQHAQNVSNSQGFFFFVTGGTFSFAITGGAEGGKDALFSLSPLG